MWHYNIAPGLGTFGEDTTWPIGLYFVNQIELPTILVELMSTTQLIWLGVIVRIIKFHIANRACVPVVLQKRAIDVWILLLQLRIEFEANLVYELFLLLKPLFF